MGFHIMTKERGKLTLFPCISAKEDQDGEHFQSSKYHAEGKHQLAQVGKARKVAHGAHRFQSGADVAHAGNDGGEGGAEGEIVDADDEGGAEYDENIEDEVLITTDDYKVNASLDLMYYGDSSRLIIRYIENLNNLK